MNKELEETINRLKQDYELAKSEDSVDIDVFTADLETILNYIENSISKQLLKEQLIKEEEKRAKIKIKEVDWYTDYREYEKLHKASGKIELIQELLEVK